MVVATVAVMGVATVAVMVRALVAVNSDLIKARDPGDNLPGTFVNNLISQAHLGKNYAIFCPESVPNEY